MAAEAVPVKASEAQQRLGEAMYRDGILPSGEPMKAVVRGDVLVDGTMFTCSSCHLRSGLGSFEGQVLTPATNGRNLYAPLKSYYKGVEVEYSPVPQRPAYIDATLAVAISSGVDPTGRVFNEIMPRYVLKDKDMALLIAYLKTLSNEVSPGVSDNEISFATVISDGVPAEDRDAMVGPLEDYVRNKNAQAAYMNSPAGRESKAMARGMLGLSMESANRRIRLSVWVLHGPPDTWRAQLEEYNRTAPAFALIGGMVKGPWRPVHEFCELHHIPCLFPITEFPVISDTDWYTLYLSKGYFQEGEAAAKYITGLPVYSSDASKVVQVVRDSPEGMALADGFQRTLAARGGRPPETVVLKPGDKLTNRALISALHGGKADFAAIWVGPEDLPEISGWAESPERPDIVMLSAVYLGDALRGLSEKARGYTYFTYPYRLPDTVDESSARPSERSQDFNYLTYPYGVSYGEKKYQQAVALLVAKDANRDTGSLLSERYRILGSTYAVIQMLTQVMMDMRGNYYRDYFLDVTGMGKDKALPLYERLSFGPGQRYASKGCYIVRLTGGQQPSLTKMSGWIVH